VSPHVSAPEGDGPRSYAVFMDARLASAFDLKRAAFFLLVPLPLLALCMHFGHGVLGLVLLPFAFWPFPYRCHVERDGLRIAWLFVNENVPWEEILSIELGEDPRRGIVGRRRQVLSLQRRSKPRLTLRGRDEVLRRLAAEVLRGTGLSSG